MTARFIAFEGGEAAGKSTQATLLAARLDAVLTREPGGTPLGARIREVVLGNSSRTNDLVDPKAEALLMAADRAHHVATVVRPALQRSQHVVTDRYRYSSIAYQAAGRGLVEREIAGLSRWATDGLDPHIVVLLDVPVSAALARRGPIPSDRMEAETTPFHERVRASFQAQADADPARWVILDATKPVDVLADLVWSAVVARCPDLL